jgi:hypothetical protein
MNSASSSNGSRPGLDLTHPEMDRLKMDREARQPPSKVMKDAIAAMVMSVWQQKLSDTTLLLRFLPLFRSPVLF